MFKQLSRYFRCGATSALFPSIFTKPKNLFLWLLLLAGLLVVLYTRKEFGAEQAQQLGETRWEPRETKVPVFLIIMCKAIKPKKKGLISDVTRQLRHARVMLKSAVELTQVRLRFIVVADTEHLYHRLVDSLEWPKEYQDKITFEFVPVWYPEGREKLKKATKECVTERLFLTTILPDEDSLVFIDNDVLFMTPPEELFYEMYNFDSKQVAAMGVDNTFYGVDRGSKTPFYGPTGLNGGVMLMNLTRMRNNLGEDWQNIMLRINDKYEKDLTLYDQDILNIFFLENPETLYLLDCRWNFRKYSCAGNQNLCPDSEGGAKLIHGNSMAFEAGNEMKLQAAYEGWQSHMVGTPLQGVYDGITKKLKEVTSKHLPTYCGQVETIDQVLTLQLLKHIQAVGGTGA